MNTATKLPEQTAAVRLTAPDTASAGPVERGLPGIRCPGCAEEDTLALRLCDGCLVCSANECETSADDLRDQIAHYTRLLAVMDALPAL